MMALPHEDEGQITRRRPISPALYDNLVHYFKYASCAYVPVCPRPNGRHLVLPFTNPVTDVQGYVARDNERKELVVALRGRVAWGSLSITDFLMDGQLVLIPFISPGIKTTPDDIRVHSGFLTCWNSIAYEVIEIIKHELGLYPGFSITVTGHSLGGALSDLAAVTLKARFPDAPLNAFSYGAPRTGNQAWAEFINKTFGSCMHRVVHSSDGVPTMIPKKLGYRHHGIEYWQHTDPPSAESTTQCSADGEDPTCSASIPTMGINPAHVWYFGIMAATPFCY
ncbi:alpha/beta-hydrolase [Pleurotus eryngii]|uniref:Alpha/beta-hydrolase n=1 Tax=Pleurotus eryngii TaxID=5323 RepID=A0A9P5ZZ21_PLEER|nr:alpha/beta-hydrolase [Pleurotus eryngii]